MKKVEELVDSCCWKCKECGFKNQFACLRRCLYCSGNQKKKDEKAMDEDLDTNVIHSVQRSMTVKDDLCQAMAEIASVVSDCRRRGIKFIDRSFPPEASSLFFDADKPFTERIEGWKRPEEIDADANWNVYDDPKPWQIIQGELGDCWLLSAMAVLSDYTHLLDKIILSPRYCSEGIYLIRLCLDGIWRTVVIDDYLPVNKKGKFVFSQASDNQLWIPLIEKAVAKTHGCYEAIVKGHCIDGLSLLTGSPCQTWFTQTIASKSDFWKQLTMWRKNRYLMSSACGNRYLSSKTFETIGLHPFHAYSILDVRIIRQEPVIQLRNPWGTTSWKGSFSEFSKNWTKSLLTAYDPRAEASRGIFWLKLDDFCKYFNSIDVCKAEDNLYEARSRYVLDKAHRKYSLVVYKITVDQLAEYSFSLHQKKMYDKGQHSDMMVLITDHKYRHVIRSRRVLRDSFASCSQELMPGQYMVCCISLAARAEHYTVVVHCKLPIRIEKQRHGIPSLDRLFCKMAKSAETSVKVPHCNGTVYQMADGVSGLIITARNPHQSLAMRVICNCKKSENVISSRNGQMYTNDVLPARSEAVLIILTHDQTDRQFLVSSTVAAYAIGCKRERVVSNVSSDFVCEDPGAKSCNEEPSQSDLSKN